MLHILLHCPLFSNSIIYFLFLNSTTFPHIEAGSLTPKFIEVDPLVSWCLWCSIANYTGVFFGSLIKCPNHIVWLHGFVLLVSNTFLVFNFIGQVIFMHAAPNSLRWKESIRSSVIFVSVHNSGLYKNTLATLNCRCVIWLKHLIFGYKRYVSV